MWSGNIGGLITARVWLSTIYIIRSIRINERTPVVRRLGGHFLVMKMKYWQLRKKYDACVALKRGTLNLIRAYYSRNSKVLKGPQGVKTNTINSCHPQLVLGNVMNVKIFLEIISCWVPGVLLVCACKPWLCRTGKKNLIRQSGPDWD